MPGTMKSCNSWPFRRCQRTEKLVAFFGQKMGCHLGISTSRVTIHVENESCSGSTQWMKVCRIDDFAQWIFHGRFVEGVGAGFLSTNLSQDANSTFTLEEFQRRPIRLFQWGLWKHPDEHPRGSGGCHALKRDHETKDLKKPRIWRNAHDFGT